MNYLISTLLIINVLLGSFHTACAMEERVKRKATNPPEASAQPLAYDSSTESLAESLIVGAADESLLPAAAASSSSKKQKVQDDTTDVVCQALPKNNEQERSRLFACSHPLNQSDGWGLIPLFSAIKAGDKGTVEKLLQNRATYSEHEAIQACVLACACGHLDVVKSLMTEDQSLASKHTTLGFLQKLLVVESITKKKISPTARISCLMAAVFFGHEDVVAYLIERGASVDETGFVSYLPLSIALRRGHLSIAQRLVQHMHLPSPDLTARVVKDALRSKQYDIVECVLKLIVSDVKKKSAKLRAQAKQNALKEAAKHGHIPTIEKIRALFNDPLEADTLIFVNARDVAVLEEVLNRRLININGQFEYEYGVDGNHYSSTAVQRVISQHGDDTAILELLLRHNAQVSNDHFMSAVKAHKIGKARVLLTHGASVNSSDLEGRSLLVQVCESPGTLEKKTATVTFLLSAGALIPDAPDSLRAEESIRALLAGEHVRRGQRSADLKAVNL